jgi:hypothetical protein
MGLHSWRSRIGMLGLVGAGALVVASRSLGAVTPALVVAAGPVGPSQTLSISASRQKTDDPVGRLQLFVPGGYTLSSPVSGARVGTAAATVVIGAGDQAAGQSRQGLVVAISPTDPAVAYESASCDPSQHLAAWMVHLNGSGSTFSFPIFVDASSGAGSSFGPYVLVACLRPPDVAPTDPNRSPNGTAIVSFTLALTPFVSPPTPGGYLWRSLWTPFAAGTGVLDDAATVEAQSTAEIPAGELVISGTRWTIKVRGEAVVLVAVSGQVLFDGQPQASVLVRIRHGATASKLVGLGRVRTGSDGRYVEVAPVLRTQYLQAAADLPAKDLGASGCQASFATIDCLDATSGAAHLVSATIVVKR